MAESTEPASERFSVGNLLKLQEICQFAESNAKRTAEMLAEARAAGRSTVEFPLDVVESLVRLPLLLSELAQSTYIRGRALQDRLEGGADDSKFGKVCTERGDFHPDEPAFLLRGADYLATNTLTAYAALCEMHGSPVQHIDAVADVIQRFSLWQIAHRDLVKVPD